MKSLLTFLMLTGYAFACLAEDERRIDSVVFQKHQDTFQNENDPPQGIPQPQDSEQIKYCRELEKSVDALKGKPLRKNAAYERYKSECLSR